jgi:hypothetical protein
MLQQLMTSNKRSVWEATQSSRFTVGLDLKSERTVFLGERFFLGLGFDTTSSTIPQPASKHIQPSDSWTKQEFCVRRSAPSLKLAVTPLLFARPFAPIKTTEQIEKNDVHSIHSKMEFSR